MEESRYRSRKFIIALLSQLTSIAALLTGIMPPEVWVDAQMAILGLYGLSNVAQTNVKIGVAKNEGQ